MTTSTAALWSALALALALAVEARAQDAGVSGSGTPLSTAPVPAAGDDVLPFSLATTEARQLVVVVTDRWDEVNGKLRRYEKVGDKWMQLGDPIDVVVGAAGLGWGLGLHPLGVGEPRKVEGDDRAPAGVFRLSTAFGEGPLAVSSKMPYLQTKAGLVCVDDPRSGAYNRIVDESARPTDEAATYKSAEKMLRERDSLYAIGVLVDHNGLGGADERVVAGRGSCVFLHVWRKRGRGTAGCTAMERFHVEQLVGWLDPSKKPVLVQLPKDELIKKRIPWQLP